MKRTPLKRKTWLRASKPKNRPPRTKYAARRRDTEYMLWVKTLRCAVVSCEPPWLVPGPPAAALRCEGAIEADHMGARGIGRKAADDTCAAMCSKHHRDRTDHSGLFRYATQAQLRAWRDLVVERTRATYALLGLASYRS